MVVSNKHYDYWQYSDKPGDERPYVNITCSITSAFVGPASNTNGDDIVSLVSCDTGETIRQRMRDVSWSGSLTTC